MRKNGIRRLRMRGAQLPPTAAHRPNHQRQHHLAAKHVMQFCGFINNVIHRREREVDRHQFSHRAQPGQRGTNAGADNGRF